MAHRIYVNYIPSSNSDEDCDVLTKAEYVGAKASSEIGLRCGPGLQCTWAFFAINTDSCTSSPFSRVTRDDLSTANVRSRSWRKSTKRSKSQKAEHSGILKRAGVERVVSSSFRRLRGRESKVARLPVLSDSRR